MPFQLYSEVAGSAENPPLLFLHGFMGSSRDWRPIIQRVGARYNCIAVDLPGHGLSTYDQPAQFTMEAAASAVIATLDQVQIAQTGLVGYSMGGRLSLYLAVHYPQRFTRLILESSSPGLRTSAERAARRAWDTAQADKLEKVPLNAFLDEWYAMPLFDSLRASDAFAAVRQGRLANDPAQLALSMRYMGTGSQPSLWDAWTQLSVPTLLVVGELDEKYVEISAEMHALNPRSTRLIVPSAGHNVHAEQPDAFAALL